MVHWDQRQRHRIHIHHHTIVLLMHGSMTTVCWAVRCSGVTWQLGVFSKRWKQLWGATNSKEAGRRGEEILGRLEMSQLINCDPSSDQSSMRDVVLWSKQSMVENWSTSTAAGEPGAAKSASICLDRMKEHLDYKIGSFDERSRRERGYIYASWRWP